MLHNIQYIECNLHYANFSGSRYKQTIYKKCDIGSSSFIQCGFKKTLFEHCSLVDSEFYNTSLDGMNFATSEIDGIGVTQDLLKGAIVSTDQALQLVKLLGLIVDETELE